MKAGLLTLRQKLAMYCCGAISQRKVVAYNNKTTVFARFVARALIIFNQTHYRALIQARALVIFKVKLCTKIIVEDKYFTTLILFSCQFIHVKRKLFTSKE